MSVTIRLAKIGRKKAHAFKIVVSTTKDKRNGKYLDILGHYNPSVKPVQYEIDKDKVEQWKSKGALVTDAVTALLNGEYEFKKYTRQNEQKSSESSATEGSNTTKGAEDNKDQPEKDSMNSEAETKEEIAQELAETAEEATAAAE
ncbi:30S ribosomal protein S16 [Candidatus Nomurabacteria bacterium]|uniref:Small ribosomal subunit protein bS16 n=1 Tax=candidate division WWE3 bacterium TaxID=2053526 RepID=A0A955IWT8_UNCKA|nr:30S ribosomal protein S16 [candidate division WWE3 bacterium]MCB9823730.1 30S ribosomal protein S16 [Candidatus Nomurabacteria bacterium]MCB9827191.1 30S ribosomal protein S16 [Candidatus Nomurabacteria bacterium]MCB9827525.1 30S ribosomal protein S16 [Candidatus Nomurabacteria bacterium]HXK52920.1 30S ribosomal protein S16 [bacterium]